MNNLKIRELWIDVNYKAADYIEGRGEFCDLQKNEFFNNGVLEEAKDCFCEEEDSVIVEKFIRYLFFEGIKLGTRKRKFLESFDELQKCVCSFKEEYGSY